VFHFNLLFIVLGRRKAEKLQKQLEIKTVSNKNILLLFLLLLLG
jgi:hypothetical protein